VTPSRTTPPGPHGAHRRSASYARTIRYPSDLSDLRTSLRAWLAAGLIHDQATSDLVVAVGEACANALEHGSQERAAKVEVTGRRDGEEIVMSILDAGVWDQTPSRPHRGRGLDIVRRVVDELRIEPGPDGGTTVTIRRSVGAR
jgi:anti-sigma regulatory factor (Ser/Thr protein kinase)